MRCSTKFIATFGYYSEKNGSMTFEGAEGAEKIKRLLESYVTRAAAEMLGSTVAAVKNFEKETFRDVEGDVIPKEKMLIFELADARAWPCAAPAPSRRSSITSSRNGDPAQGRLSADGIGHKQSGSRRAARTPLGWLQEDAAARLPVRVARRTNAVIWVEKSN